MSSINVAGQRRDMTVDHGGTDDHGCRHHDDLGQERETEAGGLVHGAFEDVHGVVLGVGLGCCESGLGGLTVDDRVWMGDRDEGKTMLDRRLICPLWPIRGS
jgi:hypothetical protein